MKTLLRPLTGLLLLLGATSCSVSRIVQLRPSQYTYARPHIQALFMDGTCNKPNSDLFDNTNVHHLYTQVREQVPAYYIDGVGNNKALGATTGLGMQRRVRYLYNYLTTHYQPGDTLCLFGFSRGAYSCRVLSNVIYLAGIPDLRYLPSKKRWKVVKKIYRAQTAKRKVDAKERKCNVATTITNWNRKHRKYPVVLNQQDTVRIAFMGLFDTVEALALPDLTENDFLGPNNRFLNQLTNVDKAAHAVALDDNRAKIFTPILLNTPEMKLSTKRDISTIVNEVWFSGSHCDIGGARTDNPEIRNNTLNWMLTEAAPYKIFKPIKHPEPGLLSLENMQDYWVWLLAYKRKNRNLNCYYENTRDVSGKIKIHRSAIRRIESGEAPAFKSYRWWLWKKHYDWFQIKDAPLSKCFEIGEKKGDKQLYKYKPDCDCIEVVEDK